MQQNKTNRRFTRTSEGDIYHLSHPTFPIDMPVAIQAEGRVGMTQREDRKKAGMRAVTDKDGAPVPKRSADGRLMYALPGGGFYA